MALRRGDAKRSNIGQIDAFSVDEDGSGDAFADADSFPRRLVAGDPENAWTDCTYFDGERIGIPAKCDREPSFDRVFAKQARDFRRLRSALSRASP